MSNAKRKRIIESLIAQKRRREEVAFLYFEGLDAEEIAEDSVYSIKTIIRDIEYIETHRERFLS